MYKIRAPRCYLIIELVYFLIHNLQAKNAHHVTINARMGKFKLYNLLSQELKSMQVNYCDLLLVKYMYNSDNSDNSRRQGKSSKTKWNVINEREQSTVQVKCYRVYLIFNIHTITKCQ